MDADVLLGWAGKPNPLLFPRTSASVSGLSVRSVRQRICRGRTPMDADISSGWEGKPDPSPFPRTSASVSGNDQRCRFSATRFRRCPAPLGSYVS
jgi:hypothetical protein